MRLLFALCLTGLLFAAAPARALIAVGGFGENISVALEMRGDLLVALSNLYAVGGTGDLVIYDATDP